MSKEIPELLEAETHVREELLETVYTVAEEDDSPSTR